MKMTDAEQTFISTLEDIFEVATTVGMEVKILAALQILKDDSVN